MPETPTGLTTLGRCLIAAGIAAMVCAVVLDERDLLRIGAFAIALPVLAALRTWATRQSLRGRRTVHPTRVSVGGQARVELTLHRVGRLPTRLVRLTALGIPPGARIGRRAVLVDAVPDALGRPPRLSAVLPGRSGGAIAGPDYLIVPLVRGCHHVGPLTVRVGDPLGMAEYECRLAGRSALTVLPRVTPLRGLPAGLGRGEGDSGSTGLRRGPGERDALIRQYRPGDAVRTVHWRSTARRDELMVRLEERPWHGGVTVLLDRREQAHRGSGPGASLEWSVELAASVCHHLLSRGRRVTLVGEDGVTLATGADPDSLLDSLAMLRPSAQPGLIPGPDGGGELFAILGAVDPAVLGPLVRRWAGGYAHAVLLDVAAWGGGAGCGVAAPSGVLTDAGWTVLVGTPNRRPDDVWDEFCRRLPLRLGTGR